MKSLYDHILEFNQASDEKADKWVRGCGGIEAPFRVGNRLVCWMFNPALCEHSYFDVENGKQLSLEEFQKLCEVRTAS